MPEIALRVLVDTLEECVFEIVIEISSVKKQASLDACFDVICSKSVNYHPSIRSEIERAPCAWREKIRKDPCVGKKHNYKSIFIAGN